MMAVAHRNSKHHRLPIEDLQKFNPIKILAWGGGTPVTSGCRPLDEILIVDGCCGKAYHISLVLGVTTRRLPKLQ